MNLNTFKKILLCGIALFMSPLAFAHELTGFAFTSLLTTASMDAVLHWIFAHQGLLLIAVIMLTCMTVKAMFVKRKIAANRNEH